MPRGESSRDCESTEKGHRRFHVQHNYHDFANVPCNPRELDAAAVWAAEKKNRGGISTPFPFILFDMLQRMEQDGLGDVVSWQPHGRCFLVKQKERFVDEVMPLYFRQTQFSSFQRQLSLYGFLRLTRKGPDTGGYYHELFLRGRRHLCARMQRTRVKGYWVRQASSPETEPDFYKDFPPVMGPPAVSSSTSQSSSPLPTYPQEIKASDPHGYAKLPSAREDLEPLPPLGRAMPMNPIDLLRDAYLQSVQELERSAGEQDDAKKPFVEEFEPKEQETLAEFLSDVDLDSSDENETEGHLDQIRQHEKSSG